MCVNGIAAIYFSLFSTISWPDAANMAAAQIAGNWIGASVSRNIEPALLRRSVVAFGLAMAGLLLRTA